MSSFIAQSMQISEWHEEMACLLLLFHSFDEKFPQIHPPETCEAAMYTPAGLPIQVIQNEDALRFTLQWTKTKNFSGYDMLKIWSYGESTFYF